MRARPRLTTPWRTPKRSEDAGRGSKTGTAAALERSTARRWRASTSCLGRAMRWQGAVLVGKRPGEAGVGLG